MDVRLVFLLMHRYGWTRAEVEALPWWIVASLSV